MNPPCVFSARWWARFKRAAYEHHLEGSHDGILAPWCALCKREKGATE